MRYFRLIVTLVFIAAAFSMVRADEEVDTSNNIVQAILSSDSEVIIIQPDKLAERLVPYAVIKSVGSAKKDAADPSVRYRVQVYSDNNRQTAKANAEYRKRLIEQRMPGVNGYVTYDAPYWRVRIGNYQTEAEAYTAMKQIKSQFPAFSSDVRVVKVRVN